MPPVKQNRGKGALCSITFKQIEVYQQREGAVFQVLELKAVMLEKMFQMELKLMLPLFTK